MNTRKGKTTLLLVLPVFLLCIFSNTCRIEAQDANQAVKYMDSLADGSAKIKNDTWEYIRTFAHSKDYKEINQKRIVLQKTINKAIADTKKIPAYNGNNDYKNSVLEYLQTLNAVMNQDYAKLVDMEQIAEESYDNMELFFKARDKANEKLEAAFAKLAAAQTKFAAENNITLITQKDELSAKIEKSSEVSAYRDVIYLIFFKSYKQEAYLLAAISQNDINAIEQSNEALLNYSTEGLKQLKNLQPFEKDKSLIAACTNMLEFYNAEAKKSTPVIIDFLLKNESFQKVKAAFDLKNENERTKEDIDLYNKKVKELNEAVKVYNSNNEADNKKRGKLITDWNETSTNFFDKHIPE